MSSNLCVNPIRDALSRPRMRTYEHAAKGDVELALKLYAWNAQLSAALLVPLHICEVVVRNSIAETLEKVYEKEWHKSNGFQRSLPTDMKRLLEKGMEKAGGNASVDKLIPELSFSFWQKMFTKRFDQRLWNKYLLISFPKINSKISVQELRSNLFDDLEEVKSLRNRIAHHEPIFHKRINDYLFKMNKLVSFRCEDTAQWLMSNQQVLMLTRENPLQKK